MTITIDLPEEVYQQLERQARARGATAAEAVAQVLAEAEAARNAAFWQRLEAQGVVAKRNSAPTAAAEPFLPIHIQGQPLSEIIIEERR